MGAYEDLVIEMGMNPSSDSRGIQLGTMTGPDTLDLEGLPLAAEDLMFDESLLCRRASSVAGEVSGTVFHDKSQYILELKEGDTVAVQKISDSLYLVLGKMVKA